MCRDKDWFLPSPHFARLQDRLVCPIGLGIIEDPVAVDCAGRHKFCRKCIAPVFDEENPTCPTCRGRITAMFAERELREVTMIFETKCNHAETQGCTWTGRWEELHRHLRDQCDFQPAPCPFQGRGCGHFCKFRKDLPKHAPNCKYRDVTCPYCSVVYIQKTEKVHALGCNQLSTHLQHLQQQQPPQPSKPKNSPPPTGRVRSRDTASSSWTSKAQKQFASHSRGWLAILIPVLLLLGGLAFLGMRRANTAPTPDPPGSASSPLVASSSTVASQSTARARPDQNFAPEPSPAPSPLLPALHGMDFEFYDIQNRYVDHSKLFFSSSLTVRQILHKARDMYRETPGRLFMVERANHVLVPWEEDNTVGTVCKASCAKRKFHIFETSISEHQQIAALGLAVVRPCAEGAQFCTTRATPWFQLIVKPEDGKFGYITARTLTDNVAPGLDAKYKSWTLWLGPVQAIAETGVADRSCFVRVPRDDSTLTKLVASASIQRCPVQLRVSSYSPSDIILLVNEN